VNPPEAEASGKRSPAWGGALGLAWVAVLLFAPVSKGGLWDPFELRSIELARRIALGLFGASGFELAGVENALPTRGEVDQGELPFTSMALGLRVFGLHPWAARLPLVLFGCAGLAATYLLARRLADRRVALLSVLVLGTMPLYFLHARTLLGDIVTMSGIAAATAGLTLALFDRAALRLKMAWLGLALLGLSAGLMSRGLLLGVSVPLLGAALAWLLLRLFGVVPPERARDVLGALVLVLGTAALVLGLKLLSHAVAEPGRYFVWLGFGVTRAASPPTFDAVIGALGHALFPWSALVPFALARVATLPSSVTFAARVRESGVRLSALLTAVLGLLAWAFVAPAAGVLPFGPVASLALLVALALVDVDRGVPASRALGLTSAALVVLLLADFLNLPDKALVAFGVEGARFPESFRAVGAPWLLACGGAAALGPFVGLLEDDADERPAFEQREYAAWLTTLRELWNGNLLFGVCVVEAALLGFLAFGLLGERIPALARFAPADVGRSGMRLAWLVPPLLLALPLVTLALRDTARWVARERARGGLRGLLPSRGGWAALGCLAGATGMSLGYYPKLVAQLSPEGTFEAFHRLARSGEELGLLGTSSATAPYAVGRPVVPLDGVDSAYEWLFDSKARRFLVLKADSLNGLNSRYRARSGKPGNLPILDGRSSEVLLASNLLAAGEQSQNPLDRYLLARAPAPTHALDANLGEQLDVLGWDVTDLDGQPVRSVVPARRYEFVVYFRVVARIAGTWESFVHIDGFQRRFNADHPTLDGHYPFSLWNVGDLIADRHEFTLEPNFTRGKYKVYMGLYSGSRRLPVHRGTATDDRLHGGELEVD
jgi:4-amino-4-deoxy-L-arabinose transferase-like glycosyltransferase